MSKNTKTRGFTDKKKSKKSPLKAKPHRLAGQSAQEEMDRLLNDKFMMYFISAALFTVMAGLEWWGYYNQSPRAPIMFSLVALVAVLTCIYQFFKFKKQYRSLKLGRDGEQAIGQYLEDLRHPGFKVFHDIVGDGFNIDHVVICEHGVFAIETKTYSKPSSGKAVVKVEGGVLKIDGFINEQIPVQLRAIKSSLLAMVEPYMTKQVPIHAAVTFPGWYVEIDRSKLDFWVLNPKLIQHFIERNEKVLSVDEVRALSAHFSRVVRPV